MPPMHCDHVDSDIMYNHDERFAHLRPGPICVCQCRQAAGAKHKSKLNPALVSCSDKLLTLITISEAVDSGWSLRALLSDSVSRFHWY